MFGGAFDPPHLAHLAMVRAALEQYNLDRLHVFPTGQAWHRAGEVSKPQHRLAMARLAFDSMPRVLVDDAELRRDGPTYSIDTLEQLQSSEPGAELFLLLGQDQAQRLGQWHRWQGLFDMATLLVASRDAEPPADGLDARSPADEGHVENHVEKTDANAPARWLTLKLPKMQVSATDIRRRVAQGLDIAGLVPAGVARYIAEHKLYQAP